MPHEKDNNYLSPPTSPLNSGFDTIESPLPSPAFSYQSGDDFSSPYSPYGHASQTHANTLHQSFGADNLTRTISYDSPGSPSIKRSGTKKSAKDTAYFKEVFSVRDEPVVPKTAGIWVEFKTNINLHNTPTLLTSLTAYLAHRYKVPPLTILLDISHSSHLSLGGTSEGCYTFTVSAVHSISPTVNKRQAIMLQQWIWENLGLAANRGIIRFNLVECANWATGGDTVLGTMEKEEVKRTGTNSGMIRGMSRRGGSRKEKEKKEGGLRGFSRREKRGERIMEEEGMVEDFPVKETGGKMEQKGLGEMEREMEKMEVGDLGKYSQETLADERPKTEQKPADKPKRKKSVFDIFSRGQK